MSTKKKFQNWLPFGLVGHIGSGKRTIQKSLGFFVGKLLEEFPEYEAFDGHEMALTAAKFELGHDFRVDANVWSNFLLELFGVMYVVDASDHERMDKQRRQLMKLLKEPLVDRKPFVIFLNKADVQGAVTTESIEKTWELARVCPDTIEWRVYSTKALRRNADKDPHDPNIYEGLKWLAERVQANFTELHKKTERDRIAQTVISQLWEELGKRSVARNAALKGEITLELQRLLAFHKKNKAPIDVEADRIEILGNQEFMKSLKRKVKDADSAAKKSAEQDYAAMVKELEALIQERDELKEEMEDLRNDLIQTRKRLEELLLTSTNDDELRKLKEEIEQLKLALAAKDEELKRLRSDSDAEISRLKAELATCQQSVEERDAQLAEAKSDIARLGVELKESQDSADSQRSHLAAQVEELTKKLEDSQSQRATLEENLKQQAEDFKGRVAVMSWNVPLVQAADVWKKTETELQGTIEELRKQVAELQMSSSASTTQLVEQKAALEGTIEELRKQLAELQVSSSASATQLLEQKAAHEALVASLKAEALAMRKTSDDEKAEWLRAKADLEQQNQKTIEELRKQVAELQMSSSSSSTQLLEQKAALEALVASLKAEALAMRKTSDDEKAQWLRAKADLEQQNQERLSAVQAAAVEAQKAFDEQKAQWVRAKSDLETQLQIERAAAGVREKNLQQQLLALKSSDEDSRRQAGQSSAAQKAAMINLLQHFRDFTTMHREESVRIKGRLQAMVEASSAVLTSIAMQLLERAKKPQAIDCAAQSESPQTSDFECQADLLLPTPAPPPPPPPPKEPEPEPAPDPTPESPKPTSLFGGNWPFSAVTPLPGWREAAGGSLVVGNKGHFSTIQSAVEAAAPGQTISILPGVYTEVVHIHKPLYLVGVGDRQQVVVQAPSLQAMSDRVLSTASSLVSTVLVTAPTGGLSNLTISQPRNGDCHALEVRNGAVSVMACDLFSVGKSCVFVSGRSSAPKFLGCRLHGSPGSGAVFTRDALGVVECCDFVNNGSAGVEIGEWADPVVKRCTVRHSKEGGVVVWANGRGTIEGCEIFSNGWAGVAVLAQGAPVVRGNKVTIGHSVGGVWGSSPSLHGAAPPGPLAAVPSPALSGAVSALSGAFSGPISGGGGGGKFGVWVSRTAKAVVEGNVIIGRGANCVGVESGSGALVRDNISKEATDVGQW